MNRELLEHPFDSTQIKQRKGRNGVLDYVEGHTVIARLNAALDGAWSFEVVAHEVRDDEVLVLGKLTAAGIVKMQFGASQVTRDRETRTALSLGDDLKAAATDALKKCATFLGVGLHLYAERPLRSEPARPAWVGLLPGAIPGTAAPAPDRNGTGGAAPAALPVPTPTPGHPGSGATAPPAPAIPAARETVLPPPHRGAATPRQLSAIWRIARAKGLDPGAVEGMSLRAFNRRPDALTTGEASALIRELSTMRRVAA
jgi:Rad52/22 family double-strand break repair protein